jgi:hypothetical protein
MVTTVVVIVVVTVFAPGTKPRALPPLKGERCHPHKREHNNGYIKGSLVLCLLGYAGQAFVSLSSGGLTQGMPPANSFPLTPFLAVAWYMECCRTKSPGEIHYEYQCLGMYVLESSGAKRKQKIHAHRGRLYACRARMGKKRGGAWCVRKTVS